MTLHSPAALPEHPPTKWWPGWDALAAIPTKQPVARWANRVLLLGLAFFALAVPHSIFAAHLGLDVSLLAWIVRDFALRKLHFRRTPVDLPLLCFTGLTVLSAWRSIEPEVSLPKLKSLLLFGALYLLVTNLHARAVPRLLAVLLFSSAAGAGFSLFEKAYGRGMVITTIAADCPLQVEGLPDVRLQPGDVIWMIAKQRVYAPDQAAQIIRERRNGERVEVEALRSGDPLPVSLTITEELKARANPLGITAAGRSRRFRVSGFARHFLTYAEQMQLLALLSYGLFLASFATPDRRLRALWAALFLLFSLALALTATRAVLAACMLALLLVSVLARNRLALLIALPLVLSLVGLSLYVLHSARRVEMLTFSDDSAARRLAYMRAGMRLIPQHPWLGVGLDAHKRHWQSWGLPGDYITHMHSTPIQLALDRGLPALGCYVWLMAALLVTGWRAYRRQREPFEAGLNLGAAGALLGFSASSLTNYNFGDAEVLLLLLLLHGLALLAGETVLVQANLKGTKLAGT